MNYDYLVVGAGLFGSVFARELSDAGRRVLVIDQRDHIAGNVFTREEHGIQVHVYGPHIFHTDDAGIWRYVNRFSRFNHYVHHPLARYGDRVYSLPINLMTLQQLWGVTTPAEAERALAEARIPCDNPANLQEWILSQVGEQIYRTLIHGYTVKQWGRDPKDLPASIIKRMPIRLNFDNNYFNHRFQGIPEGGYTGMVSNMLEGIDIRLGTSLAGMGDWRKQAKKLVFTGKIDEFFGFRFGELEYRTLDFEHETVQGDFQGVAQMNYTSEAVAFTRIVEHKHFEFGRQEKSIITREYSSEWGPGKNPYYPINDDKNNRLYRQYQAEADRLGDVIFGGRLAKYRYYDMHQVIGAALAAAGREIRETDRPVLRPDGTEHRTVKSHAPHPEAGSRPHALRNSTLDLLQCPACAGKLQPTSLPSAHWTRDGELRCGACGARYPLHSGIPHFASKEKIRRLYPKMEREARRGAALHEAFLGHFLDILGLEPDTARAQYLGHLGLRRGARLLDVGAGTGWDFSYLVEQMGSIDFFGLDISIEMLDRCMRKFMKLAAPGDLFVGFAERLPFRSNSFDAVLHVGSLNEFRDPHVALSEMARVAAPGAAVVVADEWLTGENLRNPIGRRLTRAFPSLPRTSAPPLEAIPEGMEEVKVERIWNGFGYCLRFRKPLPAAAGSNPGMAP